MSHDKTKRQGQPQNAGTQSDNQGQDPKQSERTSEGTASDQARNAAANTPEDGAKQNETAEPTDTDGSTDSAEQTDSDDAEDRAEFERLKDKRHNMPLNGEEIQRYDELEKKLNG